MDRGSEKQHFSSHHRRAGDHRYEDPRGYLHLRKDRRYIQILIRKKEKDKGRTIKDSAKICSYRPMYCTTSCYQRKQVIADFITQKLSARGNSGGYCVILSVML